MKATRCPQCEAPVAVTTPRPAHYPFCSERCQLIDLGRWLDEEYRVPEGHPDTVAVATGAPSLDRSEN